MKVISVIEPKKFGMKPLTSSLIRKLSSFGSVGTIKSLEFCQYSKETEATRDFETGAEIVIGLTASQMISFSEGQKLEQALDSLCNSGLDFAVIEGFKGSELPKIILGNPEGISNILMELPENSEINEALLTSILEKILAQPERYTLEALIKKIRKDPKIRKAGSIGTFTGIVRELDENTKTSKLEFEKYEPEASKVLNNICEELKQKKGIFEVLIYHKTGVIKAGEDIVYIVIASAHRTELFPALSEAIERIKAEAAIWKKEFTENEEFWVHDRKHS